VAAYKIQIYQKKHRKFNQMEKMQLAGIELRTVM
jgi:hypothetical protein